MKIPVITDYPSMVCRLPPLILLAFAWCAAVLPSGEPPRSTGPQREAAPAVGPVSAPQYNDQGELKLPANYRTWVFVGANLGLEYRDGAAAADDAPRPKDAGNPPRDKPANVGNFHNVYINPVAYAHYIKTGKFPDKTILVLDIFKAEHGPPKSIVAEGLFPGKHAGVAVAVKNSARPDGAKTDWAYYDFGLNASAARAFSNKACYDCHLEHADDDNVFTQFYPILRRQQN